LLNRLKLKPGKITQLAAGAYIQSSTL
jgi:hypothetical protein